ncbi:MAG TPA: cysteine desulfurase-like protein [Thermoanaerobaculia bacterium]|nr:cysteine desulfurase-like protein [Thermoanaerobaculia bacterium]
MSETMTSAADGVASVDAIRRHFPALQRTHHGFPVAYFDAPGGTQVPRQVAEAMTRYLFHHNANTHWAYPTSAETDAIIASAREAAADFLNASPSEIVFGNNMTTVTFHLGRALGRTWKAGDEVIVTDLDHHANVAPWRALETDRGIVVRAARMIPETAQLDLEHLSQLVSGRTKLIAVGGASNAVGTVNDLGKIAAIARSAGALLFVDAVHLAPHELIDVRKIGCDFLACSSYKFYGPHAGILFGRRELLASLPFPKLTPAPDDPPERAETGTQNQEGIAGIGATIDFLASLSDGRSRRDRLAGTYRALHDTGMRLIRMAWDGLSSIKRVHLYGAPPWQPRTPTLAFTVDGMTAEDAVRKLVERGLFLSHGDFYAATVIERLGVEGLVRAGCACYTTEEEVKRLIEGVERL